MDKVEKYRSCIQDILEQQAKMRKPKGEEAEVQTIFDTVRDHYQLVYTGWNNSERIYGCVLHLDIKSEKIWIQYDGTERGIAFVLEESGVPKEDIVLAFHAPYKRPYTGYAIR